VFMLCIEGVYVVCWGCEQALVGLAGLQRLSLHHNSFDRKAGRDLRAALLSSLPSLSIYGLD
jgi:hypothetical protein